MSEAAQGPSYPADWRECRLGDVCSMASGGTPSRATASYWNGDIPWVKTAEINYRTISDTDEKITCLGLSSSSARLLPPGTVVMALFGQGKTRGRVAILGIEACVNQACLGLLQGDDLDNLFLFHVLSERYEDLRKLSHDGTQQNLNASLVKSLRVPVPPRAQQRKIAKILATVDNLIEKTEALIAKYQAIKQGMMHDLFTRGVDTRGHLRPTYDEATELYKESEIGWIPKEWEVVPLGATIAFITDYRGKTPPYTNHGIPVLSAESVGGGSIKSITKHVSEEVYHGWTTRGFPEPGDVIFTTEAPVGEVASLPGDKTYLLTRRVIAFRPDTEQVRKRYLYWLLFREKKDEVWDRYAHGSTVPRILKPDVLRHPMRLPPLEEQDWIARSLDSCNMKMNQERRVLQKLHLQKAGIMQDLLTGKVRVKVDESEEATDE